MRTSRMKLECSCTYHCVSRIIERRFCLGDTEKEIFRKMMRSAEAFCGVQVLTYAIMDNHFHLLLRVPKREDVSDATLEERLCCIYNKEHVAEITGKIWGWRNDGLHESADEYKALFTRRMYDLSEFMKLLKQRFSMWYNGRKQRKGTLWEGRFKSMIIQEGKTLVIIATYIDLNAIRAGIVEKPDAYRYCGCGEAVAGSRVAQQGLIRILSQNGRLGRALSWSETMKRYRRHLYLKGRQGKQKDGAPTKKGIDAEHVQKVINQGGALGLAELMQCRVRYFTDGVVVGTKEFVEEIFQAKRGFFSKRRTSGARRMRGVDPGLDYLHTARDLRIHPLT